MSKGSEIETPTGEGIVKTATITLKAQTIVEEVEKVIVGKRDTVKMAVLSMLCNGHLLIEDIPGVGKTTLAKALAKSIGGEFRRVQFTPDLLPSDITGSSVYNQRSGEFEFRAGPVFGNVVLADEINRATPKTQSALLEAMEEKQVTTDGETRALPKPFFVVATQNTIELTGTYPLPEAQLDRFFARLSLGYPSKDSEVSILDRQQIVSPLEDVRTAMDLDELLTVQEQIKDVFVHDSIREYIVDIMQATRDDKMLYMGASPRGSLHLMRASQAHAAMDDVDYVRPDDVKAVARAVLGHRILLLPESRARGVDADQVITRILGTVTAPNPAK
jgi:MoxR-like ATPase